MFPYSSIRLLVSYCISEVVDGVLRLSRANIVSNFSFTTLESWISCCELEEPAGAWIIPQQTHTHTQMDSTIADILVLDLWRRQNISNSSMLCSRALCTNCPRSELHNARVLALLTVFQLCIFEPNINCLFNNKSDLNPFKEFFFLYENLNFLWKRKSWDLFFEQKGPTVVE